MYVVPDDARTGAARNDGPVAPSFGVRAWTDKISPNTVDEYRNELGKLQIEGREIVRREIIRSGFRDFRPVSSSHVLEPLAFPLMATMTYEGF